MGVRVAIHTEYSEGIREVKVYHPPRDAAETADWMLSFLTGYIGWEKPIDGFEELFLQASHQTVQNQRILHQNYLTAIKAFNSLPFWQRWVLRLRGRRPWRIPKPSTVQKVLESYLKRLQNFRDLIRPNAATFGLNQDDVDKCILLIERLTGRLAELA